MCNGAECRWESTFMKAHVTASNNKGKKANCFTPKKAPAVAGKKAKAGDDAAAAHKVREVERAQQNWAREAERAEKVMHLICWGPN